MAEEVLFTALLSVTLSTRAAGHHQGSHLPCGPENWREVQDEAEIYQTGPDCNRQVRSTNLHRSLNINVQYYTLVFRTSFD